jgi:hypothetical protein
VAYDGLHFTQNPHIIATGTIPGTAKFFCSALMRGSLGALGRRMLIFWTLALTTERASVSATYGHRSKRMTC